MAFLTRSEAVRASNRARSLVLKGADQMLRESASSFSAVKSYDIFLSHASEDADLVLGVKAILEGEGYSVYVDWIEDAQMQRSNVTPSTAQTLRVRMACCRSMLFATSKASPASKWMPWELGYFDGLKRGHISILPILSDYESSFRGQEYLGLYPLAEKDASGRLVVNTSPSSRRLIKDFITGS